MNSEINLIASRPCMGKTTFAMSLLTNFSEENDFKIAIFSIDESPYKIVKNWLIEKREVPFKLFNYPSEVLYGNNVFRYQSYNNYFFYECPQVSLDEFESYAQFLIEQCNCKAILIDSISGFYEFSQESESERRKAYKRFWDISRKLNVPIIITDQIERSAEDREDNRPILHDISSKEFSMYCDRILILFSHDYYLLNNKDDTGIFEIQIAKNRNGFLTNMELYKSDKSNRFYVVNEYLDENKFLTPFSLPVKKEIEKRKITA